MVSYPHPVHLSKLSLKELGYVVGLFSGDGYLYHHKASRHFSVEFFLNSINDKDVQSYLLTLLKRIGLNPGVRKDKRFNCNRIRVYSKIFYQEILTNLHRPQDERDFKLGFVSGMIDAEGNIDTKKRFIRLSNINKKLIQRVEEYLFELGINCRTNRSTSPRKRGWSDIYIIYVPLNFINIQNNSIKVKRLCSR